VSNYHPNSLEHVQENRATFSETLFASQSLDAPPSVSS